MARYGRRSNHWMWQPRSANGRFASSGGGSEPDPLSEWFLKAPWWQKILSLVAFGAFCLWLWYSGYILVFLLGAWALIFVMRLIRGFLEV